MESYKREYFEISISNTFRYGLRQNHEINLKEFLFKARMLTRGSWVLLHVAKKLLQNIIHTYKKILIIPDQLHQ